MKRRLFSLRRPRLSRTLPVAAAAVAVALALAALSLYLTLTAGLPDVEGLARYEPPETSRIFARDGTLVATLYDENRTRVGLDRMSPYVAKALVAVEDSRFYEHGGVDPVGILRAALDNLQGGEVRQGASTLTMQLARTLFLNNERTLWRKAQEAVLARRIEARFSKEQILELYLNQVYFGSGSYGIDAAANRYLGKEPAHLTAAESALLVGLLQAPSDINPLEDPAAARARQVEVLKRMLETGALPLEQYREAVGEARRMAFRDHAPPGSRNLLKYPYFTTWVIREMSRRHSERLLRRGGLEVHTSLDVRAQSLAEEVLTRRMRDLGPSWGADAAALVLLDNETGHVRAMVGGLGYGPRDRFNRAWQAGRQPGSAFKPFVFAAALEGGMTPEAEVADEKVIFDPGTPEQWSPRNADGRFMGRIPLRAALMYSRNVVAVRLLNLVGIEHVIPLARRMGLRGSLPPYLSLALGAGEATPLEMAEAFAAFANGGLHRPAEPITLVLDSRGQVVEDRRSLREERVLRPSTAAAMVEMLRRAVVRGTGGAAFLHDRYVAGKTGTTDDFRDGWFVGSTPGYTLAVWVGNDDNRPTWGMYGGTLPAQIWHDFMAALPAEEEPSEMTRVAFGEPVAEGLCTVTHFLAGPGCPGTYQDVFRAGFLPTRPCPVHSGPPRPSPSASASPGPSPLPSPAYPKATPSPETPVPYPTASPRAPAGEPTGPWPVVPPPPPGEPAPGPPSPPPGGEGEPPGEGEPVGPPPGGAEEPPPGPWERVWPPSGETASPPPGGTPEPPEPRPEETSALDPAAP